MAAHRDRLVTMFDRPFSAPLLRTTLWGTLALSTALWANAPAWATEAGPAPKAPPAVAGRAPVLAPLPVIEAALQAQAPHDAAVSAYYQQRAWEPLWFTGTADQDARVANLQAAFDQVARHGLRPPRLPENWATMTPAEKDIFLTIHALRLGRAMADGTLQPTDKRNNEVPKVAKAQTILDPLSFSPTPGDTLLALAPQTALYKGLVDALAKARQQATLPAWTKVPTSGKLSPGDDAAEVPFLRQRLADSSDYQADEATMASTLYDPALEEAVKVFQASHSLDVDGIVGVGTRAALNISAAERVDQIKINLDRLRRLPNDLGPRYLLVNVAGFEAWLYQGDQVTFDTPIVVGKNQNQTPTFSDTIRSVEFNPSWEVPRSIGLKEILPAMAKDPTYLESKNMEVYEGWEDGGMLIDPTTVDWVNLAQSRRLPYRFRQRPGAGNSLGQVKLLFPNKHDVYLHDTPSRGLFRRGQRAFSHGCMRVAKPLELAGEVLGMDQKAIAALVAKGTKTRLLVRNPLPIHITYLTTWIDPTTGKLHYAADIYGRDSELMAQLHPIGMTAESDPDPARGNESAPAAAPQSATSLTALGT